MSRRQTHSVYSFYNESNINSTRFKIFEIHPSPERSFCNFILREIDAWCRSEMKFSLDARFFVIERYCKSADEQIWFIKFRFNRNFEFIRKRRGITRDHCTGTARKLRRFVRKLRNISGNRVKKS